MALLWQKDKDRIERELDNRPCIRCGDEDRTLAHCQNANGKDGQFGEHWKQMRPHVRLEANGYLEDLLKRPAKERVKPVVPTYSKILQRPAAERTSTPKLVIPAYTTVPKSTFPGSSGGVAPISTIQAAAPNSGNFSNSATRRDGARKEGDISEEAGDEDEKDDVAQDVFQPFFQWQKDNPSNTDEVPSKSRVVRTDYPRRKASTHSEESSQIATNHLEIQLDPKYELYEYQLLPVSGDKNKKRRKWLIRAAIEELYFLRGKDAEFATDFSSTIISWEKLHEQIKEQSTKSSTTAADSDQSLSWGPFQVTTVKDKKTPVTFKFIRKIPLDKLQSFIDSDESAIDWDSGPTIRALNILVSKAIRGDGSMLAEFPSLFQTSSNKFFLKAEQQALSTSLTAIRGFYYTVKPGIKNIFLNINSATSAFFANISVLHFLRDQQRFPRSRMEDRYEMLIGRQVIINYGRGPTDEARAADLKNLEGRIKTIFRFGKQPISKTKVKIQMDDDDHERTYTVEEYLQKRYPDLAFAEHELNAVNLGNKENPSWFAPEHLNILPYQVYRRPVPDYLTKSMLDFANKYPQEDRNLISNGGITALHLSNGSGPFRTFSKAEPLKLKPTLHEVQCVKLNHPKLEYNKGEAQRYDNGKWNFDNCTFFARNGDTTFKALLLVQTTDLKGGKSTLERYKKEIQHFCNGHAGNKVGRFEWCPGKHYNLSSLGEASLEAGLKQAQQLGANFVILLLQMKNTQAHTIFKDLADRKYGIHSMCLTEDANWKPAKFDDIGRLLQPEGIPNSLLQYFSNVAMKMNLKARGINHIVEPLKSQFDDIIILGADVTHPNSGSIIGCPSIAAVVGSIDNHGAQYLGSMRLQNRDNKEMIDRLTNMVEERLVDWSNNHLSDSKNGQPFLPSKIVYYRDGVGDSQYSQLLQKELPQIRAAYANVAKRLGLGVQFDLTAIVVAKRHSTRFYPMNPQDRDRVGPRAAIEANCVPGTLVDQDITSPYFKDFYLQSHYGLQGTAKPTHYFVLCDENSFAVEDLQRMTHLLCFQYARATRSVSCVPPAYYADRLCERGRCYLRDFFIGSSELKTSLGVDNKIKRRLEDGLRAARLQKYPRPADKDEQKKFIKSNDEVEEEKRDKKSVEGYLKAKTWRAAEAEFYRYTGARGVAHGNPWEGHGLLEGSMFWM